MFANRGSATVYRVSEFKDKGENETLTDLVALCFLRPPHLLLQSARHGESLLYEKLYTTSPRLQLLQ